MKNNLMKVLSHKGFAVKSIIPTTERRLDDIDPKKIVEQFKKSGALVFKGFSPSRKEFYNFCRQFAADNLPFPTLEKTPVPDGGTEAIGLHSEYAHTPFRPEAMFFYCQTPSDFGGETTICDGIQLWKSLSPNVQKKFLNKKILYTGVVAAWVIRRLLKSKNDEKNLKTLGRLGLPSELVDDDTISYTRIGSAAFRPKYSSQLGICSNLAKVYRGLKVEWEDGSAIPTSLIKKIEKESNNCTFDIQWGPGDFAMINNTRWMHGRRKIKGARRDIFIYQCHLNF